MACGFRRWIWSKRLTGRIGTGPGADIAGARLVGRKVAALYQELTARLCLSRRTKKIVNSPGRRAFLAPGPAKGNQSTVPDLSHVMPNPRVVPILWGHDHVVNPATTTSIEQTAHHPTLIS